MKRNAYFCHPENILIAMVYDENPVIRKLGWKRIHKVRQQNMQFKKVKKLRLFVIPELNYDAREYHELVC